MAGEQGGAFKKFFERFVVGNRRARLRTRAGPRGAGAEVEPAARRRRDRPGWLGATTRTEARGLVVASVRAEGPAEAAGLYAGDELIAIDGARVDAARLAGRLAERAPGSTVRVTVFRRDELHEIPVTLGEPPAESATIGPLEGATVEQSNT